MAYLVYIITVMFYGTIIFQDIHYKNTTA